VRLKGRRALPAMEKGNFRAVSWWITWEDIQWPDQEVADRMRRRADQAAASGVNLAIFFGAHFRWDFLPLWSRLHDLIAFIREELSQRGISLFDHHSSVLTHRPRTPEEAMKITMRNRHHVPFYPSREAAAEWQFQGKFLNDWRMIDVATGNPLYLPAYEAEQFCMNNPDFQSAYQEYVRRLIADTQIAGLMSDDAFFYGSWSACGCRHCRERFRREYGHELPPVSDDTFWGNRDSQGFHDWIEMRFRTTKDFLGLVKEAVGALPLMTCCSGSDGQALCGYGLSYQDLAEHADLIMLEMTGSCPALDGTWDGRIAAQALHLAIAREADFPSLGLGYGFFPDTAFFVWACNRFLGSDPWFSTLKGRLAPKSLVTDLADDTELVEEAYNWERAHASLFEGRMNARTAVFYSRATRDYYGRTDLDYVKDFRETCNVLMKAGIDFEATTVIPKPGTYGVLVLSSVTCLTESEMAELDQFLAGGGAVVASGPLGMRDGRGRRMESGWTERYGLVINVREPERKTGFPPFAQEGAFASCEGRYQGRVVSKDAWVMIDAAPGSFHWTAGRVQERSVDLARRVSAVLPPSPYSIRVAPKGWYLRSYKDDKRLLIHGIPAKVEPILHAELENQFHRQRVIEYIRYDEPAPRDIVIELPSSAEKVALFSPDLKAPRPFEKDSDGAWRVALDGVRRYFVVEAAFGDDIFRGKMQSSPFPLR